MTPTWPGTRLAESDWHARRAAHVARVDRWLVPHLARASRGERHPVYDFLFDYYAFRPSWMRRWHPGPDVCLEGESAREYLRWPGYDAGPDGVRVEPAAFPAGRRESLRWMHDLLAAMQDRPPFFACYGLHEWAMVYRQTPAEVRHNRWPLRFAPDEIARIVEGQSICCTHFDAFRFFTAPARPLNRIQPERATVPQLEQRGCLHANMDLYKWAFKLAPFSPSDFVADCFELARDIREVDMRASPYDLRQLGFAPIPVETAEGRAEYETRQRAFAQRGVPLRARLRALLGRLQSAVAAG